MEEGEHRSHWDAQNSGEYHNFLRHVVVVVIALPLFEFLQSIDIPARNTPLLAVEELVNADCAVSSARVL